MWLRLATGYWAGTPAWLSIRGCLALEAFKRCAANNDMLFRLIASLRRGSNTYEGGSFGQAWGFNQQVSHNDTPILSIDGVCTFVAVLVYMFTWKPSCLALHTTACSMSSIYL